MAAFWIDVYNAGGGPDVAGSRVGAGPITSALDWESSAVVDAVGSITFTMPASDPKAALVRPKRVVWCYAFVNGVLLTIGAGIIDRITTQVGTPTLLRVTGPDLLGELATRTVGQQKILEEAWTSLVAQGAVRRLPLDPDDITYPEIDLPNAYDGNPATSSVTVAIRDDVFLYVGHDARFDIVRFNLNAVNGATAATLQYQYYSKDHGWQDLADVVDTCIVAGRPFAQDGEIGFTRPLDWARSTPTEAAGSWFWVRFRRTQDVGNNFDISLYEVDVWADVPTLTGINQVMAHAPAAWAGVYPATVATRYVEFDGESVLAALITLAEGGGQVPE